MPRVIVSPQARSDMDEILSYVGRDNPTAARNLIARFKEKFALLADSPAIGMKRDGLQAGLLGFPVGKYLIFYRRRSEDIEIVRVVHGARDVGGVFG